MRWEFDGQRVLVVDDGVENRELVRLVLEGAGLEVVEAENGAVALERVERDAPVLVLMDVQMPVMDGYTATRRLRESGHRLPVLALTANAMKGFESDIESAGFTGYLTKPVDIDGLLAEIGRLLGGRQVPERAEPLRAAPAPRAPLAEAARADTRPIVSRLAHHPRLARVAQTFCRTLPGKLQAMQSALDAGRMDELADLAHWLKGAGGTVGYDEFFDPSRRFEADARAGRTEELRDGLHELQSLAARLVAPSDPETALTGA
jgi:CheY-like chemotaxis protein